ncbi:glycosyltransferase family 8 protein [Providencia rettgeri]|uniref:glycosyltransferase family 8 protein n=1 Tax=Providencia rettgeri TaxID=587 RepID=UPI002556C1F6|nr:glycosyltransferase [Providencia rettgeri]
MFSERSNILSKKIKYDYSQPEQDSMNIIYGVTQNFLLGAFVSMQSVIKFNPNIQLHFHFFVEKISDNYLKKLEKTAKTYNIAIDVYIINNTKLTFLPISERWPYATFYRVIGFDILAADYKTALYLDADVICKGNLSEIASLNLHEYYFAIVSDLPTLQERAKKLDIVRKSKYFNSGVMLANLDSWKKNNLMDNFVSEISKNKDNSLFPDQDILNMISDGHNLYLDKNYNFLYGMDDEPKIKNSEYYKKKLTDDVKLIHYVGVSKPWHEWVNYQSAKFFRNVYNDSIWSSLPLEKALTAKQWKKKSSHERWQSKYFSSLISHLNYIIVKLKKKLK